VVRQIRQVSKTLANGSLNSREEVRSSNCAWSQSFTV